MSAPAPARRFNLLPDVERIDRGPWRRWQVWVPLLLAVALIAAAIAVPLAEKRNTAIALLHDTEQARTQATAADALRQQLEQSVEDYNFVLSRKYAYPSAVQLLDDITRLLPDDTWLTTLELKSLPKGKEPHREIVLRGESANAGRLVSLLEDSRLFEQAAPRSPTTKIQPGPGEIFDLGAQLKPRPLPAPVEARAAAATSAKEPASPLPKDGASTPAQAAGAAATSAPAATMPVAPPTNPGGANPAKASAAPATARASAPTAGAATPAGVNGTTTPAPTPRSPEAPVVSARTAPAMNPPAVGPGRSPADGPPPEDSY